MIDDEDLDRVNSLNWTVIIENGGVVSCINHEGGFSWTIGRFILNYRGLLEVDHVDRNPLNNQKHNLRIVTKSQNAINRSPAKGSSKYRGVYWKTANQKWMAQIKIKNKKHYIGIFDSEEKAALAYNVWAVEIHGEFAEINKIT